MKRLPLLLLVLCVVAWGQSKNDLKQQLEAAAKERVALMAALARAQALGKDRESAGQAAEEAKILAEMNALESRQAALLAASIAESTRDEQALDRKQENTSDDQATKNFMTLQIFGFLTLLAGYLYTSWRESRSRRWAREDAEKDKAEIVAVVKEGAQQSTAAIQHSNNLTEKIVAATDKIVVLREDMAAALDTKQDTKEANSAKAPATLAEKPESATRK